MICCLLYFSLIKKKNFKNDHYNQNFFAILYQVVLWFQMNIIPNCFLYEKKTLIVTLPYTYKMVRTLLEHFRLISMDVDIKDVREKGRAWDTFRDHASSWAELMMSVDTKVDHLSM